MVLTLCACADTKPAEVSREDRIDRTTELLKVVLVDDAARLEAERYVNLCASSPEEMYFEDLRASNPDGPQRFTSLDEAFSSRGPVTRLDLAAAACTPAGLEAVRDMANI